MLWRSVGGRKTSDFQRQRLRLFGRARWREIDLSHAVKKYDVLWVVCAQGLTIRFRLTRPRRIKWVPSENGLNPAYAHQHNARMYLYEPMTSHTCAFNLDLYPSECVTIILSQGAERRHLVPSATA